MTVTAKKPDGSVYTRYLVTSSSGFANPGEVVGIMGPSGYGDPHTRATGTCTVHLCTSVHLRVRECISVEPTRVATCNSSALHCSHASI